MSEPRSRSPQDGEPDKQRLTEEEKKQNHIASEQKRREAIRQGFDRLCGLVPGLEGQGRSEGHVLKESVVYIRQQMEMRRDLVAARERRGEVVDDALKEPIRVLEALEAKERAYLQQATNGKHTNGDGAHQNGEDEEDLEED